jgi:peroxiredoxin
MRPDIVSGARFPDYELPDHTKAMRKLSELQGEDPMILTLARGHSCPKEHQQHFELAALYPKIAVAYTQVATIATDDHHTLQEFSGDARRLRSSGATCERCPARFGPTGI